MFNQLTNTKYDDCAYTGRLNQSTKPTQYKLSSAPYVNCNACLGRNGFQGGSLSKHVIDTDSLLRGLGQPLASDRCRVPIDPSASHFSPVRVCNQPKDTNIDTRLDDNAHDLRGTISSRLDYPLFDHQKHVGVIRPIDTRQQAKDNFCANWDEYLEEPKFVNTKPVRQKCFTTTNCLQY